MGPSKKRRHSPSPSMTAHDQASDSATREHAGETSTAAYQEKPFRFLDLAPELRNNVYEKVLEDDDTIHLSRSTARVKPSLATSSALVRVNKQVSAEFLDMATVAAPIIKTTVQNFNFAHIITFLNRLADSQLDKLVAADSTEQAERRFIIDLTFTRSATTKVQDLSNLKRWLNRMDHPTKRGTGIRYKYTCTRDNNRQRLVSQRLGGSKNRRRGTSSRGYREWMAIDCLLRKKAKELRAAGMH